MPNYRAKTQQDASARVTQGDPPASTIITETENSQLSKNEPHHFLKPKRHLCIIDGVDSHIDLMLNSYVSLARLESACDEYRFLCYDESTESKLKYFGFDTIYDKALIDEANNLGAKGRGCDSSLFVPMYVRPATLLRVALLEKDVKVLLTDGDTYFLRNPFDLYDDGIMVLSSSASLKPPSLKSVATNHGLRFFPFVSDGSFLSLNNGIMCFTSSKSTANFFAKLISEYHQMPDTTCETGWARKHFNIFVYRNLGLQFGRNYTHPGLFNAKLLDGEEFIAFSNVLSQNHLSMADPIMIHASGVGGVLQRIAWLKTNKAWSLKSNWQSMARQASDPGAGPSTEKFAYLLTNSSTQIKTRTIVDATEAITETIRLLLSVDNNLTFTSMKNVIIGATQGPTLSWPQFCQDWHKHDEDDFIIFVDSDAAGIGLLLNQYRSLVHNYPQHAARIVVLVHDEVAARKCALHGFKHIYVAQMLSLAHAVFPNVQEFRHGPQMFARHLIQMISLRCGVSFVLSDADVVWGRLRTTTISPDESFPLFPSPSHDFMITTDIAQRGNTKDEFKFGLNGTWYFDFFGSEDELLGLCNGLMGVRATPAALAFFQDDSRYIIDRDLILTDGGFGQVSFNFVMYKWGLRVNRSSLEGGTPRRENDSSHRLAVLTVSQDSFLSPCQSSVSNSTPLFAHANCAGDKGKHPTYAEHVAAKVRWINETGFWFTNSEKSSESG